MTRQPTAVNPLLEMELSSPASAIGRQAAREARLTVLAERMTVSFLRAMVEAASSGSLFPMQVSTAWEMGVNVMLADLTTEEAQYVRDDFLNDSLPDDAYTAAISVLATHAQAFGSTMAEPQKLRSELETVFSAESFSPEQLSASADWDPEAEALTAAGFWDSLKDSGSVWIRRVRRVSRTSATGMSGWITVTAIRLQDYPFKRWVTRHDDRVRHTHRLADGQTVPVNESFQVGSSRLKYPGERDAEYGEIVSCRCVLIGVK